PPPVRSPAKLGEESTVKGLEGDHFDVAWTLERVHADAVAVAHELESEAMLTHWQLGEHDVTQRLGQSRVAKGNARASRVDVESQYRLQRQERRGRCPRLRRASDGVQRGAFAANAGKPAQ